MKKLRRERILYCETCEDGISYAGSDEQVWQELVRIFELRHNHERMVN